MNTDEERFRYLYEQNAPVLQIIAKRRGIPESEIDDIVQETFLSYYSHYPLTWPDKKACVMLVKILRNRCIDYLRVRNRKQVDFYDPAALDEEFFPGKKAPGRDTEEIAEKNLAVENLMEGLKSMNADQRQVFILYVIEERPMDEISKILRISADACRMRLSRGRKHLRKYMKKKNAKALSHTQKKLSISSEPGIGLPSH